MGLRKKRKYNATGISMTFFHVIYFFCSLIAIYGIIHIQFFWQPDEKTQNSFRALPQERVVKPIRGNILASDGRPLALAIPNYHITIDCAIRKNEFDEKRTEKFFKETIKVGRRDSVCFRTGIEMERIWRQKAREMCLGIGKLIGKDGQALYAEIITRRESGRKRQFKLAEFIDYETKEAIRKLPLAREGRYKSGLIIDEEIVRDYPYGTLARKTIGFLPKKGNPDGSKTGIEYSYDSLLRGTPGLESLIRADGKQQIVDHRSKRIPVQDGYDVRTTLDVDIQNICERELRKTFATRGDIEGGCMMVMEVATGAIKAMVNLKRDKDGLYRENYNYAVLYKGATGSVFKAASLMALLEDGKVSLNDTVSTYGGVYQFQGWKCDDQMHTGVKYYPNKRICIGEGLEISSNIVFSTLVHQHYRQHPEQFRDRLHAFHLDENFEFDIEGLQKPIIPRPGERSWSGSTMPNIAIGSSIDLCPLHTLTFYNAIAGRGRMMKPYLVEAIQKDGKTFETIGPKAIDEHICRKEVADTLIKGLCRVTEGKKGTAYWAFRNAPYRFAGKTGTGRLTIYDEKGRPITNLGGKTKNIGTFIGFFPAENPKYTLMAVGYQDISLASLYGSVFAYTVRAVADALYAMDMENGAIIKGRGRIGKSDKGIPVISASDTPLVPDVKDRGLSDAIWMIENSGYTCEFEGIGRVRSQSPAAGARHPKGNVVKIVLK
ncbi:MAG: PASTA domain-containing protein [Bacteroidales bacterium]|nr:PASTA domain-containing protein [Bacteroidales bacterium]